MSSSSTFRLKFPDRTVSIDIAPYQRVPELAHALTKHWHDSFEGYGGQAGTVAAYATTVKWFLRYLNGLTSPPKTFRFIDDLMLDGFVDHLRPVMGAAALRARSQGLRALFANLRQHDLHGSLTDGHVFRWRPDVERGDNPLADLTPAQWAAVTKLAKRSVLETTLRIRSARLVASRGEDPRGRPEAWLVRENVYWAVLHHAVDFHEFRAATRGRWPAWLGPEPKNFKTVFSRLAQQMFPSKLDMAGFWTAMAIATGLPPESITDLELDWFDSSFGKSELTVLRYRKQRKGSPTIPLVLLARPQFSAKRLRDTYVELTEPLRPLAPSSNSTRLWIYASRFGPLAVRVANDDTRHFPRWIESVGLHDAAEISRLNSSLARRQRLQHWTGKRDARRLRKTDKARRIVRFGAAAANDHSVRVLLVHYTNSDLVRVRSALIITEVADTLTAFAAGPKPKALLAAEVTARATSNLAKLLGVTTEQIGDVLGGKHTIGHIACLDPYASPFDEPGRFCRHACREICMRCPNALILDEHVPALWAEVERLDRIASTQSADAFQMHYGDLHSLLLGALSRLRPSELRAYKKRGVIPPALPDSVQMPAHIRRRRTRR